ncbi:MAG: ribose 5-phosphate isomerase B [Spirochaetes bacterium]|nr:ribose 5-phosphate isomerase B [Spirochaetota bacterium]
MKIAIASDHAGFKLKELIKKTFADINFEDFGCFSEESVDYPDFIPKAARAVRDGKAERGIAICGSGIGASITANKVKGIRASLCFNEYMAEMTRRHNDSNVLVLGARITGDDLSLAIVKRWLDSPYDGGRHQRRVDKISALEKEEC